MADDKIKDSPAPEPHVRWRRSAETLSARSDLPALLAEFVGLPASSGPLADNLISQTLGTLDALVPIGAVKTANDLVDAAADHGYETAPSYPEAGRLCPNPNQRRYLTPLVDAMRCAVGDALASLCPWSR
jgi:hypothetical protein